MDVGFYLNNYPWLRRAITAGLMLFALSVFTAYTDMWMIKNELTQNGVTTKATVTSRSSHFFTHDDEDGDLYTYKTKYEYTASGSDGQTTYSAESGHPDTYYKADAGWIQVLYSSRKPEVSLPLGEFTTTGSFLAWVGTHSFEYLMVLGLLIVSLWTCKIDLHKLWINLRKNR